MFPMLHGLPHATVPRGSLHTPWLGLAEPRPAKLHNTTSYRHLRPPAAQPNDPQPPLGLPLGLPDFNIYEDLVRGKRFVCIEGCGKCCTGAGEVWVSEEECAAIARLLGLSLQHFLTKHTKAYSKRPGWRMLKRKKGSQDCVFLEGTKCSVYQAQPLQCKTYPWWPELMHPKAWVAERETVCPGISHESAPEADPQHAGQMLQLASEQLAALQAAALEASSRKAQQQQQQQGKEG